MKIGNIIMPEGAALAPMAGITDVNTRLLAKEQGCAWAVSEMLSAKGFVYMPDARIHRELLAYNPDEGITGLQLFGSECDMLSEAVQRLNDSPFAFFDFNMGCPAHKIICNGEGSALMREPQKAGRLIQAMALSSQKPVTVKIRAGWDSNSINAVEIARIAEDNGAAAITVHPRTREMQYSGHSYWNVIENVKHAVSIPVIGNGDIISGESALRMLGETGCDAVMVARAAQGNPWIFREIYCAVKGLPYTPPDAHEKVHTALRHMDMQIAALGERLGIMEMRKHIAWYLQGLPGSARIRSMANRLNDRDSVVQLLTEYENSVKQEMCGNGIV